MSVVRVGRRICFLTDRPKMQGTLQASWRLAVLHPLSITGSLPSRLSFAGEIVRAGGHVSRDCAHVPSYPVQGRASGPPLAVVEDSQDTWHSQRLFLSCQVNQTCLYQLSWRILIHQYSSLLTSVRSWQLSRTPFSKSKSLDIRNATQRHSLTDIETRFK